MAYNVPGYSSYSNYPRQQERYKLSKTLAKELNETQTMEYDVVIHCYDASHLFEKSLMTKL